ncbi:MAG: DUF881 domain-containing protein [Candidatus Nanopelagicales bacterium]
MSDPITEPSPGPWRRLGDALSPEITPGQVIVGILFALLGFGVVVQVSQTTEDQLQGARQADLVRILDDLGEREERLRAEARDLEETRDDLLSGSDQAATALEETRQRAETLGVLAGTIPAQGSGIVVTVTNLPEVDATLVLDALQELRDAGAEVIQIGEVRVIASTYVLDDDGDVIVDGTALQSPLIIRAIGDPRTMSAALRIPGGVVDSLRGVGSDAAIQETDNVEITALRAVPSPEYARPAPE